MGPNPPSVMAYPHANPYTGALPPTPRMSPSLSQEAWDRSPPASGIVPETKAVLMVRVHYSMFVTLDTRGPELRAQTLKSASRADLQLLC